MEKKLTLKESPYYTGSVFYDSKAANDIEEQLGVIRRYMKIVNDNMINTTSKSKPLFREIADLLMAAREKASDLLGTLEK